MRGLLQNNESQLHNNNGPLTLRPPSPQRSAPPEIRCVAFVPIPSFTNGPPSTTARRSLMPAGPILSSSGRSLNDVAGSQRRRSSDNVIVSPVFTVPHGWV